MANFGAVGEERITIRNLNTASQKMVGHESADEIERDALSNIRERNASRAVGTGGAVNSDRTFGRDCELETTERRPKRKQENSNIQLVSSDCSPNNQPSLSEQCLHDARLHENGQTPARELQACGFPEIVRSKRRRETGKVHEVGLDISLRTDGSHGLQGLGFDISVSSSVAVGIKHATCSILPDKDTEKAVGARVAVDVANNKSAANRKKDERVAGHREEPRGMTVEESRMPYRDFCSMSTTVTSGQKSLEDLVKATLVSDKNNHGKTDEPVAKMGQSPPMVENLHPVDQLDIQKLQVAVALLHSQLEFLQGLADKGSKECKQCESVKEGICSLLSSYCEWFTIQKPLKPAATPAQRLSSEETFMCNSPVGSCTIEEKAHDKEDCGRHLQETTDGENVDTILPSEMDIQTQNEGLLELVNMNGEFQQVSDTECHLCIELGSPQSDDPDADPAPDGSGGEECNLRPSLKELPCDSQRLHTYPEENQNESFPSLRFGEVNSELAEDNNSCQVIEDDHKGEESSAKSSKGEGCWNSVITRTSDNSYGGRIEDQAERDGYIDLRCGCTSQKFGDTFGILRLYQNGKLEIQCQCSIGCIKGKRMSPASFERHGGRGASKKWRDTIWIVLGDEKVQFSKVKGLDAFVRRYKDTNRTMTRQPAVPKQSIHRDEFLVCKNCFKRRRFHQKTKEECRLFHEASMNPEWECSDHPNESFRSCHDEEEREARQAYRGCIRSRTCPGCLECVCVGCFFCRFEDCECRLCTEFIANNK